MDENAAQKAHAKSDLRVFRILPQCGAVDSVSQILMAESDQDGEKRKQLADDGGEGADARRN